jgi:hypothetical protein
MQKKVSKKHSEILGVFIENRAVAIVELKKCRKWHRNPRCTLRALFEIPARGGVFRTFNWIGGKISEKAFSTFWKNFHFCVFRLEVGITFYGAKIWTSLFSKSAEHVFGFGSDFAALLEKIRPDENDDAYRLPYRLLREFPYAFLFRFPAVKWRQKKVNGFAVLWDMKEEEVDVIPGLPFSKTRFPRF